MENANTSMNNETEHKAKHLIPQSKEEWVDFAVDKVKEKIQDTLIVEPAIAGLKATGENLIERAAALSVSHGELAANVAQTAGKAAVSFSEAYEVGAAAVSSAALYAAGLGAEGYGVYKGTRWVDDHTNHAITGSAPAKAWGEAQERSGADERLWYAQQAKESFDKQHPEASPIASGLTWAKALVDPHMADNHALTLQSHINQTLEASNKSHAAISFEEAKTILDALNHAKPGDMLLIDKQGNVELGSGMAGHPVEKGTTTFDAVTLRMAANQRYEGPQSQTPSKPEQAGHSLER